MKADLSGQIHELMERGVRPATMADIKNQAPLRVSMLQRAAARSRLGRPRRPSRAIVAAVAGALALVTIATAIGITSHRNFIHPAADQGAIRLLSKVADVAARQPTPHVRDSQYMYVETTAAAPPSLKPLTGKPGSFSRHIHLEMVTSQVWVPVDNLCRTGLERGITAQGHTSSSTFSARQPGVKCPNAGGLNDPTYRLLQTLPTNPHALLAMIYRVERGHGPGPAQEAFVTIGDLLRSTIAPPKVAAALYRAAALIPGVILVAHATDAIGRHGVAVARIGPGVDGGVLEELIFSQAALQLIGERTVIARTGVTTTATAIIARAFVDHRGQVPPGPG